MTDECKSFITGLLEKDSTVRLGTKGSIEELLEHPWFSDIDKDALLSRKLEAPFIPELSEDLSDVSNFDS